MSVGLKTGCASLDAEFDRLFGATDSALSADARRHLDECERCRKLYSYLAAPLPPVPLSPELSGSIGRTIKSTLKPVRPIGSTRTIAVQLFLAFVLIATLVALTMNGPGWMLMSRVQLGSVVGVFLAGAALLSLSLAWQMTPGSLQRIPAKAALMILSAAFLVVLAMVFPWHTPEGFVRLGVRCLKMGLTAAAPAAVLFGILLWRGVPLGMSTLGATLGAIAGLLAVAIQQFNCDTQDAIHLLVWHGAILAIPTLTGFLIGRLIASLRR